jgi:hypothetical protein
MISGATTGSVNQGDNRSTTNRLSADTGFSLFSDLNTKIKYEYEQGTSETISRPPIHDEKTIFPGINGQWSSVKNLPLLNRFAQSSSIRFGYEQGRSRRGEGGLTQKSLLSESNDRSFSPLFEWTTSWERKIRTTVRMTKKNSRTKDMRDGESRGITNTTNNAFSLSVDYSLSAASVKKLPLLGRLRSDVNLSLDVTQGTDRQEQALGDAAPVLRRDDRSFSIKLDTDYKFSSKFTGGAKIEITNRHNVLTETTRKIREVGFWGEINFN